MSENQKNFVFKTEALTVKSVTPALINIQRLFDQTGVVAEAYHPDEAGVDLRALAETDEEQFVPILKEWAENFKAAVDEGTTFPFLKKNPMFWHVYHRAKKIERNK